MDHEKKFIGKWWMWMLMLVAVSLVTFGALSYVGIIGRTVVERKVFENSFQYSETRKAAIASYNAELSEIQHKLNGNITEQTRTNLEAAASAIRIRIATERGKQ